MLIGINNSVLYIAYLQNVNNKVIPYCFFHNRPKALAQFDPKKVMFYTLMEKGRHMLKKIEIYIGSGCRVGLYNNKQISYQSPIIAHHT